MKKNKLSEMIRNLTEEEIPGFKNYYSQLLAKFGVSTRNSIQDDNKLQHFDNLVSKYKDENQPEPEVEPLEPETEQIKGENEDVVDETTSSGATPGYLTPQAFSANGEISDKQKKTATVLGMTLVKDPDMKKSESKLAQVINVINETFYFKDDNLTAEQKIGLAMRQVRNHLTEVERVITKSIKLKQESGVSADDYGKRTYTSLKKINEKVIRLMIALNDIK